MLTFFLAQNALTQSAESSPIGPVALLITVVVVIIIGLWYRSRQDGKGTSAAADTAAPAAVAQPSGKTVTAPGSFGEIQLVNVDDKTAATLMAIVADELKTPLNQLRFLSIRQLKEGK